MQSRCWNVAVRLIDICRVRRQVYTILLIGERVNRSRDVLLANNA
jgi:hypothetical protein